MILENIRNALRSIRSAKVRSTLTMLGMIIGVYAVVTMLSIGNGVKAQVTQQISNLGSNLLTVSSGQILGSQTSSNGQKKMGGGLNFASSLGASTLTTADAASIARVSHVMKVASINIISSNVVHDQASTSTAMILATQPSYAQITTSAHIASGHFITTTDDKTKAHVAVIGATTATNLFGSDSGSASIIGQTILIRNQPYQVIGVLAPSGSTSSFGDTGDDIVYIPFQTAQAVTGVSSIYRIVIQVDDSSNINSTQAAITRVIKANHGGQEDFSVLTQKDLVSAFSTILDLLTSFIIAIASVSLLVGGIGIMNIMLVSVSERTREIGIRKAVGATGSNILWQFLIESIVISILGGVIGIGLAFVNVAPLKHLAKITPVFTAGSLILAFGVAFLIGVIFGIVPAVKAAHKRPIQALKAI